MNGNATQGENIADLGGINLGWDAFMKTEEYKRGQSIGGLTPAQRYFIGQTALFLQSLASLLPFAEKRSRDGD